MYRRAAGSGRLFGWHSGLRLVLGVFLLVGVTACGGDDDDGGDGGGSAESFPLYDGAETLGSREWTEQETSEFAAQTANGGGSVAVTDASLDDVKAYYSDGVEEDGWTSDGTLDIDEDSVIATMHQDDQVAFAYIVRGAVAKGGALDAATTGFEIDQSQIDDADTVIAFSYFTCEEDDVQACVTALATGAP